jgi:hypothetical protein
MGARNHPSSLLPFASARERLIHLPTVSPSYSTASVIAARRRDELISLPFKGSGKGSEVRN